MAEDVAKMSWKTFSSLVGKHEVVDRRTTRERIADIIRVYDSRVTAGGSTMAPPDLADRLKNLVDAVPPITKRDVLLTGLAQLLEICERSPGQLVPELKLGAFKSRGQTNLGFRIPLELDDRLRKLLRNSPRLSKRDVLLAALDLILTQCEAINGGPFPADMQAVSEKAE